MRGWPPRWESERNPSLITLMEMFSRPLPDLPGIPVALIDVLRAGMANDPKARPSALELCELLASVPLGPAAGAPFPTSGAPVSGGGTSAAPASGGGGSGRTPLSAQVTAAAAPRSPAGTTFHDATPTVRTSLPRRGIRWLLGSFGIIVLAALGAVGTWAIVGRSGDSPTPTPSGLARPSASTRVSPSLSGGGALPGCLVPLPGGARCPAEMECFGPVRETRETAQAERVPCAGRHTWESYAVGDVPGTLPAADYGAIKADPTVRAICNPNTFLLVTLKTSDGWKLDVLPPTAQAAAEGDRSYRCVAGKGVDQLSAPTLGH
jgi:hypothetical protein